MAVFLPGGFGGREAHHSVALQGNIGRWLGARGAGVNQGDRADKRWGAVGEVVYRCRYCRGGAI